LHLQDAFVGLGYKYGDFPISEDIAAKVFSIPMHPYLSHKDQDLVINSIKKHAK